MIPGFAAGGQVGISTSAPSASTIGHSVWAELVKTVKNGFTSVLGSVFGSHVPNVGGGVARWAGLVRLALAMEGLSQGLAGRVLYQMSTESGGNPNAQNNWDINAQRGDPSRGLMQTIGSTFRAYHWPGTSWNIFDPLANIAAAINYARHVCGPTLGALGSGHGYALGTPSARAGWAIVGERGPELVGFRGGETVVPNNKLGGNTINYYISVSPTPTAHPRDIGKQIVDSIKEFEKGSGKAWRS
jgi:hypothetical protein